MVRMASGKEALLAVHSRALTGHDVETIVAHAHRDVRCECDGRYVGQGPEALRKAIEAELAACGEVVARVTDLDGEPVVVEYEMRDGVRSPRAVLRIGSDAAAHRILECRIDHGAAVVGRLASGAKLR